MKTKTKQEFKCVVCDYEQYEEYNYSNYTLKVCSKCGAEYPERKEG